MKAAVIREFGAPEVLLYEEVETPRPRPSHVLVKLLAAGINRLDHYLREGSISRDLALPHILGADGVGEVAELGRDVGGFEPGQRVIVVPGYPLDPADYDVDPASTAASFGLPGFHVQGTYAQYIEVPARFLVADLTGLPSEQAATLPMVLATSVRAVKEVGGVKPGDAVLVQAGGSGSGSMQLQVARALGARVATTVRDDAKAELARNLGAELVINTRRDNLVERVRAWTDGRGADVVVDNLGGDVLAASIEAARPQGVVVAYGFAAGPQVSFDVRSLFFQQKSLKGSMASDKSDLLWGLEQVRAGKVRAVLDRALALAEAAAAHRLVADNRVAGNLVLLPWAA